MMSEWPSITVITPVYNCVDLLEECIRSVLDQQYPRVEYGVVDGASTDGSVDVIRRYEDRLAFWTSERDGGQADALNKGFRRASGELVGWLNADDFYYPGALASAAHAYRSDPAAPFYFGNGDRVDRAGRRTAEFFPGGKVQFRRDALAFGLNYVLQPATFIRRTALEEVGLLDAELHYGFDSDLWLKLSELGRPRPIRKRLAASREYEETKTATGSFDRAEELRRIAERHSGVAATPGSISYYLHTLHDVVAERRDVFPRDYAKSLESFWAATSDLLSRYGARSDGFPLHGVDELVDLTRPVQGRLRVGIELRHVTKGVAGGIVAVLAGALRELFARRPDLDFVVFCTVFNRELLAVDAPNVDVVTLPLDDFFSQLGRVAVASGIEVLFRSYPTVEQVDFPLSRQIFLLPDVQHEFHPEFFDSRTLEARRLAFGVALGGAAAIMTISEFARRTIQQQTRGLVFVAPPSLPPEFARSRSADATEEERRMLPSGPYFFFPANLWPHKNHRRLFAAFRRFRERTGSDAELVLTGSPAGWEELGAEVPDLPIRHLGYVSPAVVRLLYEHALALTFFSEYEGFGIPLLEAFDAGTPVVCSNTTSLPEVAGDAALMCDPTDVEGMAQLLEGVAGDSELRARLAANGRQRLALFSWVRAADELGAAIELVARRIEEPAVGEPPLVSIVTPSYNQGRYIRRTIESVLTQSYPNIEYLVIDGGSSDETLDILRSFGNRVSWISEPDGGQADAINKGLRAARGQIVGYLNSDDVLLPHAIEDVVRHLREHPDCDLVYGDAEYIDESGAVVGMYRTATYSFERLMEDCCICQPAAYWRASAGAVVGTFDEGLDFALDYDYWIRLDRSGFLLQHMPKTIAQSRLHSEAKTLRGRPEIYNEIFRVCLAEGGYVSRSYVHGFWDHLVQERTGPARVLRFAPPLQAVAVELHFRLVNLRLPAGRSRIQAARFAARRRAVRRLRHSPRLFAFLVGANARLHHGVRRGARLRVSGFWPDNWTSERLDVVVDSREQPCSLCIVGRPVAEMTVRVSANGTNLGEFELKESERETVKVQLPAGPRELVSFSFSDHAVDANGRRVAFLVQETNLFREEDLYSVA
jgi:glycosyltransferase involved in cell wall biosynthesis